MTEVKDVKHGKPIYKVYKIEGVEVEGDPKDDNAPLTFTITTDVTDRDKDIVDPAGAVVENYSKNAVMQWAHQYDELPVGKSVEMFATKIKALKDGQEQDFNAIKARVVFQPDSNYHDSYTGIRGSMVRRMYVSGFLNAVSIGFDPMEWEPIEEKSDKTPSELLGMVANNGTRFVKWDLLEFSAVPVPANPQALVDRNYEKVYKSTLKRWAADTLEQCKDGECPRALTEDKQLEEGKMELKHTVADDRFVDKIKALIIKEGRVLSGKNETDLKDGVGQINAGVKKVNDVLGKVNGGGQGPPEPPTPPVQEPPKSHTMTVSFPLGHEASNIKAESEEEQEATPINPEPSEVQAEQEPEEDIYVIDETVYDEELQAYITQVRDEAKEDSEDDNDLAPQREEPT